MPSGAQADKVTHVIHLTRKQDAVQRLEVCHYLTTIIFIWYNYTSVSMNDCYIISALIVCDQRIVTKIAPYTVIIKIQKSIYKIQNKLTQEDRRVLLEKIRTNILEK